MKAKKKPLTCAFFSFIEFFSSAKEHITDLFCSQLKPKEVVSLLLQWLTRSTETLFINKQQLRESRTWQKIVPINMFYSTLQHF